MTTLEIILLIAFLLSGGLNISLCLMNDKKDIQITRDEAWKVFANLKIKELEKINKMKQ